MSNNEQLVNAEQKWLEAVKNNELYDVMYWRGVIEGLKVRNSRKMKWVVIHDEHGLVIECPECGGNPLQRNGSFFLSDYCPHCGENLEAEDAED